jgi:hypothetical protein
MPSTFTNPSLNERPLGEFTYESPAPQTRPMSDTANLYCYLRRYFQDHPTEAALYCFGAGFLIGWKLRPW